MNRLCCLTFASLKYKGLMDNIHPIFDNILSRDEKESILGQRGLTIWFTGLSGSGKSTIANLLERKLSKAGVVCKLLDGDNIRNGINKDLDFSPESRKENIRRIAEINRLFNQAGIVTLSAFISPTKEIRQISREIIEENNFKEIYISTSLENCEKRDVKGLYKKAREGVIKNFTGISAPYEAPEDPFLSINTIENSPESCANEIYSNIIDLIEKPHGKSGN